MTQSVSEQTAITASSPSVNYNQLTFLSTICLRLHITYVPIMQRLHSPTQNINCMLAYKYMMIALLNNKSDCNEMNAADSNEASTHSQY